MNDLKIWIVIGGLTLVTFVTRSLFQVLGDRLTLPERVQHALRYAPGCALAALIGPELLVVQGALDVSLSNPKLVAGVVAGVSMLATRSVVVTIGAGMAVFTLLRLFG
jgi:branched-subunit amino acid transport protein